MTASARDRGGETTPYTPVHMVWGRYEALDDPRAETAGARSPWMLLIAESGPGTGRDDEGGDRQPPFLSEALKRRFRLTRSEARVALLLASRCSNQEIAELLGVTAHTARRHTEKVLLKLGIHSRMCVRSVIAGVGRPDGVPSNRSLGDRSAPFQPEGRP